MDASWSNGQDERRTANQLTTSCPLVEQVCDGKGRGAEIETGWRGEGSEDLDCGIVFISAEADRLAVELFLSSQKAMRRGASVCETAHDLAAIIDRTGYDSMRAR